jgi:hypothetical protein
MQLTNFRIARISALVAAMIFATVYFLIWGFAMSFGMSLDSAGSFYIALYPLLILPIVITSFFSQKVGLVALLFHIVISWAVAAMTPLPSIYLNPLDSRISFFPFTVALLIVVAFICSRKEGLAVEK